MSAKMPLLAQAQPEGALLAELELRAAMFPELAQLGAHQAAEHLAVQRAAGLLGAAQAAPEGQAALQAEAAVLLAAAQAERGAAAEEATCFPITLFG